jgi:hypothetical protein
LPDVQIFSPIFNREKRFYKSPLDLFLLAAAS